MTSVHKPIWPSHPSWRIRSDILTEFRQVTRIENCRLYRSWISKCHMWRSRVKGGLEVWSLSCFCCLGMTLKVIKPMLLDEGKGMTREIENLCRSVGLGVSVGGFSREARMNGLLYYSELRGGGIETNWSSHHRKLLMYQSHRCLRSTRVTMT